MNWPFWRCTSALGIIRTLEGWCVCVCRVCYWLCMCAQAHAIICVFVCAAWHNLTCRSKHFIISNYILHMSLFEQILLTCIVIWKAKQPNQCLSCIHKWCWHLTKWSRANGDGESEWESAISLRHSVNKLPVLSHSPQTQVMCPQNLICFLKCLSAESRVNNSWGSSCLQRGLVLHEQPLSWSNPSQGELNYEASQSVATGELSWQFVALLWWGLIFGASYFFSALFSGVQRWGEKK